MAAVNDANRKTGLILEFLLLYFNVSLLYVSHIKYLCWVYVTFIINLIEMSITVAKNAKKRIFTQAVVQSLLSK
jgi:hypothetical protein